jgi:23S rRNA pseudouridine2457 synthase
MMQGKPTLLFYKPDGVLSTFTDTQGRQTLKDYIPVKGIYSAGRLDYDSEGLLVITADGGLIKKLTDPLEHVEKTYLALVEGEYEREKLNEMEKGIQFKDYLSKPCKVMWVNPPTLEEKRKVMTPHGPTFWLRILIAEGKKHEVRKLTAAIGYPCLRLIRVAIGKIGIGDLRPGQWRELTADEIRMLKKG